ncbi:BnaC07g16050D [Brassica napus]|uniref:BnaC07g16050D protein n=1 Tax=Brassica napus TaxID=3708 RepID=A0A078FKX6_BRANA|nr:BnaC07g16050D [Brassica napus]
MYSKRKAALKQWFKSSKQRVSLTTDIWTAKVTGCSYMVITAHYIDAYWCLKKLIIGFKYVTDHKGKTISSTLSECLAEWGIDNVFCVTVDNATANSNGLLHFEHSFSSLSDEALVMKGEFMHMRCAGHIINLIVKDGLTEVDESIASIRNGIAYVRSGPIRQQTFEVKVDSGKMKRGSLPLDVPTRWNSTYLMLQRALKFKVAFDKMGFEDKPYNDHFMEFDKGKKRVGPPTMDDWRAVERLEKFLIIFYNSTLVVSASTTLNAHKCYSEIVNIASSLKLLCNSYDTQLKVKAEEMSRKYEKYWDGVKNINKMLIVASIFDPSRKMKFTKLCFEELYGEDTVEAKLLHDSVLTLKSDLFS